MRQRRLVVFLVLFFFSSAFQSDAQELSRPSPEPVLRINADEHTSTIRRIGADVACKIVATSSEDKTIRIWGMPDGKLLNVLRPPIGGGHEGKLYAVGVAPVACPPDLTPGQRFESGYFQLLEGDLEMARKGKSTEEIVGFLREAEVRISQGETVGKICRSIGVSEQTYYKWRREYGGLKIDQARRLKDLERENDRLKRAVSELTLDKLILKEALSGKY